ncbi:MAG: TadE/TadG family type IV pilus assembly protein [Gemmataceae bacterium]
MLLNSHKKDRSGAAAVEVALVLMILLVPMLLGVWEVGRLVHVHQLLSNAAREAGRQASTANRTNEQIRALVLNYLRQQGLTKLNQTTDNSAEVANGGKIFIGIEVYDAGSTEATPTPVQNESGDPLDAIAANQNDKIQITVTVLFNDVEYSPTNFFLPSTTRVSTTVSWNCMRDVPLMVNQEIPLE